MHGTPLEISRDQAVAWLMPFGRAGLQKLFSSMLGAVGFPEAEAELVVLSDTEIAGLNEEYLGCSGPTNVLSFPEGQNPSGGSQRRLGTIFISPQTLRRECSLYGMGAEERCAALLAHALAHLLGYDHGEEMDDVTERAFSVFTKAPEDF